ncbi:MAG: PolC-type DNA polymerase III [Bilifractor sp.]
MGKASYVKKVVGDYCVPDTETTGLSAYYDEVIEIGMLKVRNGQIVDKYSQLIEPQNSIDPFLCRTE